MAWRSAIVVALALLAAACLQDEGMAPSGAHLFHGQHLASPGFFKVGDKPLVRFKDRIQEPTPTRAGIYDLWTTSYDGSEQRKVVANGSDFSAWGEQGPDNAGDRYFMVDERLVPTNGGKARTATLLRLGPNLEELARLEGIWAYMRYNVPISAVVQNPEPGQSCPGYPKLQNSCPQILYERPAPPGQTLPTLYLWDGQNEIPIGGDAGSFGLQTTGSGNVYFLFESQRYLVRLLRPQNILQVIRPGIARFQLSGDERFVALVVNEADKQKTVILDLTSGKEVSPARPNPSMWSGFGGHTFFYQYANGSDPTELHRLDLDTGDDAFDTLPKGLQNLSGMLDRPNSDERLLLDGSLRGVFTGKSDYIARRALLPGPLYTASFTHDGKYLVYVSPAAATLYDTTPQGPLMFQDAELQDPPIMFSPPGLLVETVGSNNYFFTGDNDAFNLLVFWAHLGRASSDLYFADYGGDGPPTNLRLMGQAILNVSISAHSLFGIVDLSQQDAVGDLVYADFDSGKQTIYAHAVSEAAETGGDSLSTSYAAYIVRGRADSDRSGLWLTTLAPPAVPDGGND